MELCIPSRRGGSIRSPTLDSEKVTRKQRKQNPGASTSLCHNTWRLTPRPAANGISRSLKPPTKIPPSPQNHDQSQRRRAHSFLTSHKPPQTRPPCLAKSQTSSNSSRSAGGRMRNVRSSPSLSVLHPSTSAAKGTFADEIRCIAGHIKRNGAHQIKFKVRCSRLMYTLVLRDSEKADKLKQSLPPSMCLYL
jgi:hypothetical protein